MANQKSRQFRQASRILSAVDAPIEAYFERTCRNFFWIGGQAGQLRIRDLSIAIAGLGGIGGMIAQTLVRAGVGHLRIADLDRVDQSNINRQAMARKSTLGMNKADAMAKDLREISDDYELVVYDQGVHEGMVDEFVDGVDAIVDEIDVFALDKKLALHRAARKRGLALYSAYAVGMGIRFFKYQGERYRLEDFLGEDFDPTARPDGTYILNRIGYPLPNYLSPEQVTEFQNTINTGGAPIFGPATLLGHSLVSTRIILDLLGEHLRFPKIPETPVMPEFLSLDAGDFSFRRCRTP